MDGNTHSDFRAGNRSAAKKRDAYTVHLLTLDGTIATVRKRHSDGSFQLLVDIGDLRGERRISEEVARDPRSDAFARAVGEVKAELLGRKRS